MAQGKPKGKAMINLVTALPAGVRVLASRACCSALNWACGSGESDSLQAISESPQERNLVRLLPPAGASSGIRAKRREKGQQLEDAGVSEGCLVMRQIGLLPQGAGIPTPKGGTLPAGPGGRKLRIGCPAKEGGC